MTRPPKRAGCSARKDKQNKLTNMRDKMKKVYITEENKEQIEKMCEEIHKGCKNHLLTYADIVIAASYYTNNLKKFMKKHHKYINYVFSLSEAKCNAYKYAYQADDVVLSVDNKGIYINKLHRKHFYPNSAQKNGIVISCKAEEKEQVVAEIKDHLFKQYFVITW